MIRLFIRFYIVIVLALGAAIVGTSFLVMETIVPERNRMVRPWMGGSLNALVQAVRDNPAEANEIIARTETSTGAEIDFVPASEVIGLSVDQREQLDAGVLVLVRNFEAYLKVDEQRVLRAHLYPHDNFRFHIPVFILLVTITIFSGGFWLVIRPVGRHLSRMEKAAERFGSGELDARTHLEGLGPVATLGQQFDRMADQVQALIESREELLRAVSHELRTPLSRLFFAVGLIADAESDEERAELAEEIQQTLEEMKYLTGELLTFARLSEGTPPINRSRCSLTRLSREAAEQLPPAEGCVVEVHTDGFDVDGDPVLLQRALRNLLANARRHAHSQVTLSFERGVGVAFVHVDDDGEGIPLEEREQIMEPFVRLEGSRSRDTGGAGLGLAIVTRVMHRHGGVLRVSDAPIGGARFTLRFPGTTILSDA